MPLASNASIRSASGDGTRGRHIGTSAKPAQRGNGTTRDPERTKASILSAATREFTEKGFGGARVDNIARRAKINKRMLYHYFGGKELLYVAVLEESYAAIRSAEGALDLGHRAPRDAMQELVLFTWHYYLDHPEFLSLLGTENLMRGKFVKRSQRAQIMNSPIIAALDDVLGRGAKTGVFKPGLDPLDVYLTIAGLGFFYLSNRYTLTAAFGRDLMDKAELARWGDHIVDVVLTHLTP